MVEAPPAAAGAARPPRAASAEGTRWVVTVCGAVADEARSLVEEVVVTHGGVVNEWRKLGYQAHEMIASGACEEDMRVALRTAGINVHADIVLQRERDVRLRKRLAVFDLDSTLIAEETIDELALEAGVQARVRELTIRAMAGDLGFRDALKERVALLKGVDVKALDRVRERATLTTGAKETVKVLRLLGCKTAVVSGGFHFLADQIRDSLQLDYAFANSLQVQDGKLTGLTTGEIVDAEYKANALAKLAVKHNVPRQQVMAVGDGSNDLLMIQRAGLGVAFNAKPKLQLASKACVNQPSLINILYLLGLDDNEIVRLVDSSF